MGRKSLSGVVMKETFAKARKRWFFGLILTNLFYILVIVALSLVIAKEEKEISSCSNAEQIVDEYRTKDKLYGILRNKGYSLGQGLDIVEAIARKSRDLELPLSLIMAVIEQESEFYPNARSTKGAQGLMQVMPLKWDEYVLKLDLKVDKRAMTDPFMNITVGCQILKDFYDRHNDIRDHKVRMAKALTDYNSGEKATKPNLKYALEVNRKLEEYERNFSE
jgi:soluble lytic murein transglycosylase-like protein